MVLSNINYSSHLTNIGEIEKSRIKDIIMFLKTIPILNDWTNKQISYLYYKVESEHFIYKQNASPPRYDEPYIYIVQEGEFEQIGVVKMKK